ncbi:MAG: hypothetical protein J3K34DRAFT_519905 [Monoraphidium minutum]|nr:MAG: hypothetical protein J3K34DRAFT_519905 [Monoraphidium minutum]
MMRTVASLRQCSYRSRPPRCSRRATLVVRNGGMYVPSDSFGGVSPEQKAANHLRSLFTFVACKVILAQLEGSGRGALGAYDAEAYTALAGALQGGGAGEISRDPDAFVERLFDTAPALARRVIEVRDAYGRDCFEWDQLQRLALRDTQSANLRLMRKAAAASLKAAPAGAAAGAGAAAEAPEGGGGGGAGEEGPGGEREGGE